MSKRNPDDLTPEYDEYSLAALLEEYTKIPSLEQTAWQSAPSEPETGPREPEIEPARETEAVQEPEPLPSYTRRPEPSPDPAALAEAIAARTRRSVAETLGDALQGQAGNTSAQEEAAPETAPEEEASAQDDSPEPAAAPRPRRRRTVEEAEAALGFDEPEKASPLQRAREKLLAPVVRLIATRLARAQQQQAEAANWPEPVEIRETPELTAAKAGKFYNALLRPLRLRLRIAVVLCLILAWISMQLPMAGMLGSSVRVQAGVCVLLTLTVMVTALDVFAAGIRQLFELRPGAESLAALAALFACLDGILVLFGIGENLPYCAIGAVALTAALWGERLTCTSLRRTFKVAAASKTPSVLSSEPGQKEDDKSLLRSDRDSTEGIVRRSESQDMCANTYATAAPFLLGASLLLSIIASVGNDSGSFLHTLSALVSVSASFAAFFSFSLPWAITTRKLRNSGVALAGYAGCADIGKTRRIIISDEDLFPAGTLKFSEINIQEGIFPAKVVTYTASLISASGSGVTALFDELVNRRDYRIPRAEEFVCHEGGGLSGLIHGERVLVGSAGFMNLMGIRLPMNLQSKNSICTAIGGELVGVFAIDYVPVTSVQEALVTLLRGRTQAVFAIRDFNITPRMIAQLFRMHTDSFNFPSFKERFRLSEEARAGAEGPLDAVITRSGMLPLVEAAESGRKIYSTCRMNTILSLAGTVIGMVIMFLLCRAGSFDTATAGNVLSFMLLWALPVVFLSVGQNRS